MSDPQNPGIATRVGADGTIQDAGQPVSIASDGTITNVGGVTTGVPPEIDPATGKPKVIDPAAKPAGPAGADPAKTPEIDPATGKPRVVPDSKASPKDPNAPPDDPRMAPFTAIFEAKGDLTSEDRDKAAKDFGVSRALVDAYVEGQKASKAIAMATVSPEQKALVDAQVNIVHSTMGGKENWETFRQWADGNNKGLLTDIAQAADGRSPTLTAAVVKNAYEQFKKAGGGPAPVDATAGGTGSGGSSGAATGFASREEQRAAINDPRYQRDANYRRTVEQRIAVTKFTE